MVSLKIFRKILKGLRLDGKRWWIACDLEEALEEGALLVGYGDPGCKDRLNNITFRVPILPGEYKGETLNGLVLLIEPSVISIHEPGLYLEGGLVVQDFAEDWRCFYEPLRTSLLDLMQSRASSSTG